jgi:hypothetical protein
MSHLLMENRHGLIVDAALTAASTAERDAAITMLGRLDGRHRSTLGADKAYDVAAFIDRLRAIRVTPHVAQNIANRRSAIDGRTTPATPSASGSASASRRRSAGSRPAADCGKPATAARPASAGPSP